VTDKETDGQTHDDSIYGASTASRGKDDGSGDGSGNSGISQTFVRPSSTCRTSLLVGSKNIAGNSIAPGSTYERRQFHDKNTSICESAVQQHTSANHCMEELLVLCPELYDMIRYDTRCYFNVRSKADMSQLNLPHGNNNKKV